MQFEALSLGPAAAFEQFVEITLRDATETGEVGVGLPVVSRLFDRLGLEVLRVTLAAHGTPCLRLNLRLRSVYWSRGDSGRLPTLRKTVQLGC